MFKIGAFSQLTGVTIKTLHYYDRVGLLKPAEVDHANGYRYYTVAQIDRLNRILALKDLGLSLEEIHQLLFENPSASELRGMLRLKQAQLHQSIAEEQARLARVEARLRQIEREGNMPVHEVVIRQAAEQRVLAYREILPNPRYIKLLFMRVSRAIKRCDLEFDGPWQALYHHGEYREHNLDVEIAVPVTDAAPASVPLGKKYALACRMLPAAQVATTLCRMESQADVYAANRDLGHWIVENGYRLVDGPCREVYIATPQPHAPIIFEVQIPVAR